MVNHGKKSQVDPLNLDLGNLNLHEVFCYTAWIPPQESQARQASSTTLSIFTIAVALSCTLGGIVYDLAGWIGVATYHSAWHTARSHSGMIEI